MDDRGRSDPCRPWGDLQPERRAPCQFKRSSAETTITNMGNYVLHTRRQNVGQVLTPVKMEEVEFIFSVQSFVKLLSIAFERQSQLWSTPVHFVGKTTELCLF